MQKKFEINLTKIKGGCQSGRKMVTHNSKSDLPLIAKNRSFNIFFCFQFTGTVDGDCRFQTTNSYGFCDCVELEPDYYDEDFIDLVETGLINERTSTCPPDQGRRCYSKKPIALPNTSGRIFFGK